MTFALTLLAAPGALGGQDIARAAGQPVDTAEALHLFLDCQVSGCDFDYLRTQLTWVNYVRDRTAAQVHVIATSLPTGSRGERVTLKFQGTAEFTGVDNELTYVLAQGVSHDDARNELARVLKIGLAPYAQRTGVGRNLVVNYVAPPDGGAARHARDPWRFWVFSVAINGSFTGESQSSSRSGTGALSASRTTADWKLRLGMSGSTDRSSYQLEDGSTFVARSHSYYASWLLVRSWGDHLSAGGTADVSSLSRQNLDFSMRLAPALEFDFFKYDQYSRRRLVATWSVGLDRYVYADTTIFNRTRETRMDQQLSLSYASTQPWGSASVGINGFSYLSDFHQNRLSLQAGLSLRVARGLQVSYSVAYARVRDQIALARGDASDAEILLKLRQLATSYTYNGYFGLSYTFGSLFNNVVNPRMGY